MLPPEVIDRLIAASKLTAGAGIIMNEFEKEGKDNRRPLTTSQILFFPRLLWT